MISYQVIGREPSDPSATIFRFDDGDAAVYMLAPTDIVESKGPDWVVRWLLEPVREAFDRLVA